jgi:hypothetical protein
MEKFKKRSHHVRQPRERDSANRCRLFQ